MAVVASSSLHHKESPVASLLSAVLGAQRFAADSSSHDRHRTIVSCVTSTSVVPIV